MKRTSTLTYISLSPLLCLVLVWIFWDSRRPSQRSTDNAPSRRFLPSATVEDPQQSAVTPLSDLGAGEGDWEDVESPKEVETAESQQVPAAEEETENSEGYEEQRGDPQYQGYPFKMHEPGSLTYADFPECPNLPTTPVEQLPPVDERLNFLLILGAQKAGTSWLFNALETHPLIHGGERGYRNWIGQSKAWAKEIHFFDHWPINSTQEYLDCFSKKVLETARAGPHVLLDATPAYLFTPAAPPRVKQMLPNAKFVIVLREPASRVYSAWKMLYDIMCSGVDKNSTCPYPTLESQAATIKPDGGVPQECLFYDAAGTHTWGDCWACKFGKAESDTCISMGVPESVCQGLEHCQPPRAHMSYYAPQIAWWLAFFPPEQFLIFTSDEINDPEQQIKVLNRIRKHAGIGGASPFTHDLIASVSGFMGSYSHEIPHEDAVVVDAMREAFDLAASPLQRLMDEFFPDHNFTGFGSE